MIVPTLVQGDFAAAQIAAAIRTANEFCDGCPEDDKIDVLIVGRGGGSAEDLWAFNEERVARAIRASRIPVISAVGHEIDFTIADMAADLRAPTPSAAAEIVAASEDEILERLDRTLAELRRHLRFRMLTASSALRDLILSPVFTEFPARVRELGFGLEELSKRLSLSANEGLGGKRERFADVAARLSPVRLASKFDQDRSRLAVLENRGVTALSALNSARNRDLGTIMARLDTLSPLSVLKRGYAIAQNASGKIVRNAHQTNVGDVLDIRLGEGSVDAEVISIKD